MNLYKQYLEIKKQHSDALVFYRVGDFYELFGSDAITASEVLDLTLTSRDCGLPERVPMCGVPFHSVDIYIAKLVEGGYKTAICEPANAVTNQETADKPKGRLNLTATGTEQTILKEYLESNASELLAEKINNGVKIVKDDKALINKKTLETFLTYACEEARKLAEKGARAAVIKSDIVFGWAIHYFEEDSIEGTLYNEDGTEYKPKPVTRSGTPKTTTPLPSPQKPKPQAPVFDLLNWQTAASEPTPDETKVETVETVEAETTKTGESEINDTEEIEAEESEVEETEASQDDEPEDWPPEGLRQLNETQWVDNDGVIYDITEQKKEFIPETLVKIFGDTLVMR